MSVLRAIPIQIHAALEVVAAPLLIVAPFALGFGYLAGALSIALGVALIGLALSVYGDDQRGSQIPLTAHAGLDYCSPRSRSRSGSSRRSSGTSWQQSFWSGSAPRIWR